MPSSADTPALDAGVIAVDVGQEAVVWVERTGALHLLDPIAACVLRRCDGTLAEPEIVVTVADDFGLPPTDVQADVGALLQRLREAHVLAGR